MPARYFRSFLLFWKIKIIFCTDSCVYNLSNVDNLIQSNHELLWNNALYTNICHVMVNSSVD